MLEKYRSASLALATAKNDMAQIRADIIAEFRNIASANPGIKLYPSARRIRYASANSQNSRNSGNSGNSVTVAEKVRAIIAESPNKALGASAIREAFRSSGDNRTLNFTILAESGIIKSVGTEAPTGRAGRPGYLYALA